MKMDCEKLFEPLYRHCDGAIELRALVIGDSDQTRQGFFDINDQAGRENFCKINANKNLYLAIATRNNNGAGGTKEDIEQFPAVWTEVDYKDLSPDIETAREILKDLYRRFPYKASATVISGGGVHFYWFLKEPVGQDDLLKVEDVNERICQALHGDASSKEAARVLRIPGTRNYKYDPPRPVILSEINDFSYELDDFLNILPEVKNGKISVKNEATGETKQFNPLGWQDSLLEGVKGGARHDTALRLAGRWAEKGHSETEIIHFITSWNQSNTPPKPELSDPNSKEMRDIITYVKAESPGGGAGVTPSRKRFHLTDLGNAKRLVEAYGKNLHFCYEFKQWFAWNGALWVPNDMNRLRVMASNITNEMHEEVALLTDKDEREKLSKHAFSCESKKRIQDMIYLARDEDGIIIHPDEFDKDKYLFNCLNGTINLRTGELQPHNKEDLITKMAPVNYDPNAECPGWVDHLNKIMARNEEKIEYFQRVCGYTLTGDTAERKFFVCWGGGANGKSLTMSVMAFIMKDYSKKVAIKSLMVKRLESISNDIAKLRKARFVFSSEGEQGKKLAESLVQELTGEDVVTARFLYAEEFEYEPEFKLFLATNHKPVIVGTHEGIWDRIRLIPFNVRLEENERIPKLEMMQMFENEAEGILAWMVRGCLEWQRDGLGVSQEVVEATKQYRNEMDILGDFLGAACKIQEMVKVKSKDLYEAYEKWCDENGEEKIGKLNFTNRMKERGFVQNKGGKNVNVWRGVELLADFDKNTPKPEQKSFV